MGGYTGTTHFDLSEFDTQYPTGSVWVDRRLGEDSTARIRYDYGYAWVDNDSYLSGHTITGSFFHSWGESGRTEATVAGYFFDFLYDDFDIGSPAAPRCTDVERDGEGVVVGAQHSYAPGWRDLEVRAGYRFDHYDSNGCEYQYDSHEFSTGFDVGIGLGVDLDSWVSFTYAPYEHVSAYLAPGESIASHRDRTWRTGVSLERALTDRASILARYDYMDSGSNTDAYDFDRHVVGAYVRFRFD